MIKHKKQVKPGDKIFTRVCGAASFGTVVPNDIAKKVWGSWARSDDEKIWAYWNDDNDGRPRSVSLDEDELVGPVYLLTPASAVLYLDDEEYKEYKQWIEENTNE